MFICNQQTTITELAIFQQLIYSLNSYIRFIAIKLIIIKYAYIPHIKDISIYTIYDLFYGRHFSY